MADDIGIQQEMLIEPTHKKLEIVDGHAVKDVEDYQNPELLYKSLIERVRKYHPSADVSMIEKAYHIARDAHKGQTRKSGEEYIIHPLWVGIILAQLEMDKETIVAGILHDVVEDTVMTDEEIRQEFGDEVALLVDGVTKLGQLSYSADKLEVQAENLRKMFLAMAKDIRVIIIKLADRLHNMRTLQYMRPEKQLEKAKETMDIYAPIAQRLGISKIKTELDDLALKYSQPEVFNDLVKQINARKTEREEFVQQIVDEVSTHMKNANIDAEVNGRVKHFFSIYKKMVNQDKTVDQIYDLFAVRIIVDSVKDCYAALGVIHEMYTPVPGRFKDYIAMPKANMYQSLHTTLMSSIGQPFEIQIRTKEMHKTAEYGIAAHWKYKESEDGKKSVEAKEEEKLSWLRQILEWQRDMSDNREFLNLLKGDLDLFAEDVYCFTPNGDVKNLPNGSTPVDFAYAVHSSVGDKCVGAKINGEIKPLRSVLQNGDQVEVLTSKAQHPSTEWERFVVTGKAKAAIRRYVRACKREQFLSLGKDILEKLFKQENLEFNEKAVYATLPHFESESLEDLYAKVGEGLVTGWDVLRTVYPAYKQSKITQVVNSIKLSKPKKKKSGALKIEGLITGMAVHFAGCCHPIPGDRIVGIVTTGKGVAVHSLACKALEKYADEPERWLDISWGSDAETENHTARIKVMISNEPGTLGELSNLIARQNANITNLNILYRTISYFEILVDVDVKNTGHLNDIIAALRASKVVSFVARV